MASGVHGATPDHNASSSVEASQDVYIWDMDESHLNEWIRSHASLFPPQAQQGSPEGHKYMMHSYLWKNLMKAVAATQSRLEEQVPNKATSSSPPPTGEPPSKRAKKERKRYLLEDPHKIWLHLKESSTGDAMQQPKLFEPLPSSPGGKLAELTVAGVVNGLGGQLGGLVDKNLKALPAAGEPGAKLATAYNITIDQLKVVATAIHRCIQTRLETDTLNTTPLRIHQILAQDLSAHEFQGVRRRVYDTVVLGKGLKIDDAGEDDIPVAANAQNVHDIDKFKKCKVCGNNDQSSFILDRKNGDVICENCGTVVSESIMHEGSQFRKFEGEVDRNHHGDAANPLLSNAHNMSTTLGGVQVTSGAGIGGFGSQGKGRGLETVLRNAHAYTELNVSSLGKEVGRTRVGYKDKQKKQAFIQMTHVGDALNLHEAVIQRAKEIFAGFRDDRELLHQLKAVIGACLCEAFDQLANTGRQILQQQEQDIEDSQADDTSNAAASSGVPSNVPAKSGRAARRAALHKASMAGKGGLLLDFSETKVVQKKSNGDDAAKAATTAAVSVLENKPTASWDIEDCRSWLLEASKSVAQRWVRDREKADGTKKTHIPNGSLDELEGRLVEKSMALCEVLETEMKLKNYAASASKRVVTPRVQDMTKLGIRWQHSHERGSGGKGGVGNSGKGLKRNADKISNAAGGKRTPGQILLLKTAKRLGELMKDPEAGNSIHSELRGLIGRQDARKRRELREEAARQRLTQMKRKPWLQAKVEQASK